VTVCCGVQKLEYSIWKGKKCFGSGRCQSLYLFIRRVLKQTAVTVGTYRSYQVRTEFYPPYFSQS
jgi:hypothetical protein